MMLKEQQLVQEVSLELPAGISAAFTLHGQEFALDNATCHVIKDAGDDPDITNRAEVHVTVTLTRNPSAANSGIIISGGTGIGRATKPGLAVAPGEYAINPVPRRMIEEAVQEVLRPAPDSGPPLTINVVVSIPDGEQRALKTLNSRLGIIGGLSILGTTGIVKPVSAKAWTDTIDAALDVAAAGNCETVVCCTGRTSELAAQRYLDDKSGTGSLPEEAYVMMGDHVAHALRSSLAKGFKQPVVACQFAKLVKIACGHENTHAAASEMDLQQLLHWAEKAQLPEALLQTIRGANTAREVVIATGFDDTLLRMTAAQALLAAQQHAPGITPLFLVADYSDNIIFDSSST